MAAIPHFGAEDVIVKDAADREVTAVDMSVLGGVIARFADGEDNVSSLIFAEAACLDEFANGVSCFGHRGEI